MHDPSSNAAEQEKYRREMDREADLLQSRLNTLLSSQSFLVIAYATSMSSANGRWTQSFALLMPPFLAALGFILALAARNDIVATQESARHWQERLAAVLERDTASEPAMSEGSRKSVSARKAGELFASRAPLIMLFAWAWFFSVPLYLRYSSGA